MCAVCFTFKALTLYILWQTTLSHISWTGVEAARGSEDAISLPKAVSLQFPDYHLDDEAANHTLVGLTMREAFEFEAAALAFASAAHFYGGASDYTNLADAWMRSGQLELAKEAIDRALELRPHDESALSGRNSLRGLWLARFRAPLPALRDGHQYHYRQLPQVREKLIQSATMPSELASSPAKVVSIHNGRQGLFHFLASSSFQDVYWEQWPVFLSGKRVLDGMAVIEDFLADPVGFELEGKGSIRSVRFLNSSFDRRDVYTRLFGGSRAVAFLEKRQWHPGMQREGELRRVLRRGYSLQFPMVQKWLPSVAEFSIHLSQAVGRPCNTNAYVTPAGKKTALSPHTDLQCSLMAQLRGEKRWRLWKKVELWLPVRFEHLRGRDLGDIVSPDFEVLGEPYMDVVLRPGDLLYVPRGCLHWTSTDDRNRSAGDADPSLHLTLGLDALMEEGLSTTWESFFGSGFAYRHKLVTEGLVSALQGVVDRRSKFDELGFRKAVPPDLLRGEAGYSDGGWRKKARTMLHALVDELFDHTDVPERIQKLMLEVVDDRLHALHYGLQAERAARVHRSR